MSPIAFCVPVLGAVGLAFSAYRYWWVVGQESGTAQMQQIVASKRPYTRQLLCPLHKLLGRGGRKLKIAKVQLAIPHHACQAMHPTSPISKPAHFLELLGREASNLMWSREC